ncbi:NADH-quinone oxidoreductase subunit A 1 [Mycolicibacterium doricum]|jgi:NADH-quinone oxidoreductase subunit A|uniref:NADH-quinone oxidoreductase subunit n=1 Tax=Mycolicibacterium doricum TaxID=126673 RepID=A0A1X1TD79_9MYCO|nr:NADH-quinone oxidoreductase subunit A [Mycolicibacterium doricum]MCV7266935.1 NADH-quinone oxidoreductase subunit A [Mycolicibacterium doricum]ORV42477.1 NADH-quinone oxidoreductase subunit I [Mycolicibacterium doricum]BBZ08416.1 NADH-quinone oxidoreductase subunit A 1 [Mycolicibacterium doricum]
MYTGVASMLLVTVVGTAAVYGLHRLTAVAPNALTSLPYQSGWQPEEHALSRYHVRWYPATLVFLAFDVEMLFMYPWAIVVAELGLKAIVEMFLFLGALFVAVAWAWREGALRWV